MLISKDQNIPFAYIYLMIPPRSLPHREALFAEQHAVHPSAVQQRRAAAVRVAQARPARAGHRRAGQALRAAVVPLAPQLQHHVWVLQRKAEI